MKFTWVCACLVVMFDCIDRAMGAPNPIIPPDYAWTWWICAAAWAWITVETVRHK